VEQTGEAHVPALLRTEQSAAPDCLQRPLRFRFRQQVSFGVRLLSLYDIIQTLGLKSVILIPT